MRRPEMKTQSRYRRRCPFPPRNHQKNSGSVFGFSFRAFSLSSEQVKFSATVPGFKLELPSFGGKGLSLRIFLSLQQQKQHQPGYGSLEKLGRVVFHPGQQGDGKKCANRGQNANWNKPFHKAERWRKISSFSMPPRKVDPELRDRRAAYFPIFAALLQVL